MRQAFISNFKPGHGYGHGAARQKCFGLDHPQVLLVLQRRGASHGLKMLVKGGRAHARDLRQFSNKQWFGEVGPDLLNGSGYAARATVYG